jgi:hypothetical protein
LNTQEFLTAVKSADARSPVSRILRKHGIEEQVPALALGSDPQRSLLQDALIPDGKTGAPPKIPDSLFNIFRTPCGSNHGIEVLIVVRSISADAVQNFDLIVHAPSETLSMQHHPAVATAGDGGVD